MSMKDISDYQVLRAFLDKVALGIYNPVEIIIERTGQPEQICYRCLERAVNRDLLEYGVSIRGGWLKSN